jgi:hypothetical protein
MSDLRYFPKEIKQKRQDGTLRLEDFLALNSEAQLRIYAFAYRPYTGTQWMRRGKYYRRDVQAGSFKKRKFVPSPTDELPEVADVLENHISQASSE